jgi:nucleoside-diphosphate-sugar epimerase
MRESSQHEVGSYLVTGCAGFIGSSLVDALLARGLPVVGVDSFTGHYGRERKLENLAAALADSRFTLVEADLASDELQELLNSATGVFHLAAQPGVRSSWGQSFPSYLAANVLATQRLFEAAAVAGVRVVFASSSSVYGAAERYPTSEAVAPSPISPYGVTKRTCELLAGAYASELGLDSVALRYFTVYGPRQRPDMAFARILAALENGEVFSVYGDGHQVRDFTFIEDAVEATLLAMARARAGAIYNVGGGTEATLLEAMTLFERLSGRELRKRFLDSERGDVRRTAADPARIRTELGWEPHVTLERGILRHLTWAALSGSETPVLPPGPARGEPNGA